MLGEDQRAKQAAVLVTQRKKTGLTPDESPDMPMRRDLRLGQANHRHGQRVFMAITNGSRTGFGARVLRTDPSI